MPVVDLTPLTAAPVGPPRVRTGSRNRRPAPTLLGGVLLFFRGLTALALAASVLVGGNAAEAAEPAGQLLPAAATVIAVFGAGEILLAWGVLRDVNLARVTAMLLSVAAIIAQAVNVRNGGPRVDFETNLLGLSLDILLIIALTSERSRAYARNHSQGRVPRNRVAAGLV